MQLYEMIISAGISASLEEAMRNAVTTVLARHLKQITDTLDGLKDDIRGIKDDVGSIKDDIRDIRRLPCR
jgi:archaellum component FlaC